MVESLLLPLRAPALRGSTKDSLQVRIGQINNQKGAFRHITEASLLEEINSTNSLDNDVDMDSDGDEVDEKPEDRQAMLWKGREEMLQQIDHARNETLTALDFVSFLLSKHVTTAQTTMSPVLKDAVSTGSLDSRVVTQAPTSKIEERRTDEVQRGWKMQSFASAAEKISAAGSKLQEEAERESRYWEQVSSLKSKGWAVSRLPRDSRTVGVHFGFPEAVPAFRNRGFAMLRRGPEGSLTLDHGAIPSKRAVVQVSVSKDGIDYCHSAVSGVLTTDKSPVEKQILQAHSTLFEEELFHEIGREGRLLANQGVRMSSNSVNFELEDGLAVKICLENPGSEAPASAANPEADNMAEIIAIALRVLLTHAHQQNLQRRSETPSPMTLKAKPVPEYALLRPIICLMQHELHVTSLRSLIAGVLAQLPIAGVHGSFKVNALSQLSLSTMLSSRSLLTKSLLGPLIAPVESSVKVELPTARKLEVKLKTYLGSPIFGTEFSVSSTSHDTSGFNAPRLETISDVEEFVTHTVVADLATYIEGLNISYEEHGSEEATSAQRVWPRWKVTDSDIGELSLQGSDQVMKKLQVKVGRNRLGLRCLSKSSKTSTETTTYIWEADKCWRITSNGREEAEVHGLVEVVRGL